MFLSDRRLVVCGFFFFFELEIDGNILRLFWILMFFYLNVD